MVTVERAAALVILVLTDLMRDAETARARISAGELHRHVRAWRDESEGRSPRTALSPRAPELRVRSPLRKVAWVADALNAERRCLVMNYMILIRSLTSRTDHEDWLTAIEQLLLCIVLETKYVRGNVLSAEAFATLRSIGQTERVKRMASRASRSREAEPRARPRSHSFRY